MHASPDLIMTSKRSKEIVYFVGYFKIRYSIVSGLLCALILNSMFLYYILINILYVT